MLITPATFFKQAGSVVSTTDLVSFWKLDESSGTRFDAFGSNDLTDNNTVGQGTGTVYANAADFVRANSEYLSIADNASLSFSGDDPFTISFWMKTDGSVNNQGLISKYDGATSTTREWVVVLDPSLNIYFYVSPDGSALSFAQWGAGLSTGTWYHVVAYHDPDADEIGIIVNDGTPVTTAHSTGVHDDGNPVEIGSYQVSTTTFDGLIEGVGIWNRVLSSAEITALADASDPFYDQF